jgi:hypothetical protein
MTGNHPPKATLAARRTPPETVQAIITRYQQGETAPTIAQALADRVAALGTTTRTIRAWARATGHPVPAAGQVPATTIDAYQAAHPPPE